MTRAASLPEFEKLGLFYLGRERGEGSGNDGPLLLYDSRDLTTHAVIVGMTGSGKTGLGIDVIEEAAMDRIPVIAIDPKGDLANLLLTFPEMRAADFRSWVDVQEAARRGLDADAFAAAEAGRWRTGLAQWGVDPGRIRTMRENAEFAIYTPGSTAGIPISLLRSFVAPADTTRADRDGYLAHVQATATSLLALLGIDADPVTSREHVLLSTLLQTAWDRGQTVDLAALVEGVQRPPFATVGVMDLESAYPATDRARLALRLNNLLAAPAFAAWREGVPLDTGSLLYASDGKPRVSVISIAHLSDAERMFFVTMLLSDTLGWMRRQQGTSSLRALLYMDELTGYMPPVANPPSKPMLLALLKQARAFGLGLVLATQNPVDLDYKGLSNAGTWFIGRLQTERDKARVMDGLEGAAARGFDRGAVERAISGLDKRVFYLHNVHDDSPVIFETRWAMSYLAGPMTRSQIEALTPAAHPDPAAEAGRSADVSRPDAGHAAAADVAESGRLVAPAGVVQYFLPVPPGSGTPVRYDALALGAADVTFANAKEGVSVTRRVLHACAISDAPVPVDWSRAQALDLPVEALASAPVTGAVLGPLPGAAANARTVAGWSKQYERWLRAEQSVVLLRSQALGATSLPEEAEGAFRARLQVMAREKRDAAVDALRARYAELTTALRERLARAEQAVSREQQQARTQTLGTAVQFGVAVLGAVLGRRRLSVTNASRAGTAIRGVGRMRDAQGDVGRAEESAAGVRQQIAALEEELQRAIAELGGAFDAQREPLEPVPIRPRPGGVHVHFATIGWRASP